MFAFLPGRLEHFVIIVIIVIEKNYVLCALWLLSKVAVVTKIDDAPRSFFWEATNNFIYNYGKKLHKILHIG